MRLTVCALSAVLLSGCSWFGGTGYNGAQYGANSHYNGQYGANPGSHSASHPASQGHCQISAPTQPIPYGCDPAEVTLATGGYGQFPQKPNFSSGYISGGYGTHVDQASTQAAHYQPKPRLRKPIWRGHLSLGIEPSVDGNYLDYNDFPTSNPAAHYDPDDFAEGRIEGSIASGAITQTTYTAIVEEIQQPNIQHNDVYKTPLSLSGGVEFIASPRTTIFANAGFLEAGGESFTAVTVDGELRRSETVQNYDTTTGATVGPPITNVTFIPNRRIAEFDYEFTELERISLEAGARHYFDPVLQNSTQTTITPFVSASAGASHYNAQSFDVSQRQVFFEQAFNGTEETAEFYDVIPGAAESVDVYNAQWVPNGAVTAGVEWQMTPKTALAFETGVRLEGGRKYTNDQRGDTNISIPLTIRGSYNF